MSAPKPYYGYPEDEAAENIILDEYTKYKLLYPLQVDQYMRTLCKAAPKDCSLLTISKVNALVRNFLA